MAWKALEVITGQASLEKVGSRGVVSRTAIRGSNDVRGLHLKTSHIERRQDPLNSIAKTRFYRTTTTGRRQRSC